MIGINFPFAEKEEKEMSSPSRLKGEKDRGGSAHCFVNIFFFLVARQTEGGRRKESRNQHSMEETSSVFCCIWNEVVVLWRRLFGSARK